MSISIDEPRPAPRPPFPAVLALGFRPFFLAAAAFACVGTGLWLHVLPTGQTPTAGYLLTHWHAHEMIFGFTLAVIAGFLLTAAKNWTGRPTASGYGLLGLVLLWLAGRLSMSGALPVPAMAVAALNIAMPLALAAVIGRVILAARSARNYGIVAVLGLLTLAAAGVHLQALGVTTTTAGPGLQGALHLIILLTVVVGGRVVPLFTRNRTEAEVQQVPSVDRAALAAAATVALLAPIAAATTARPATWALAAAAAASGVLQLVRMRTWATRPALRIPMLAVLHIGYAWIGIGQLLLALSLLMPEHIPPTTALHGLTLGAVGGLTLGMMARVTRGHTGRPIEASPLETTAFWLMALAAPTRLAALVLPPAWIPATWHAAGALFILAFAAYLIAAWRALTTPRPDGRPG